jgi:hypothetical protein
MKSCLETIDSRNLSHPWAACSALSSALAQSATGAKAPAALPRIQLVRSWR